MKRMRGKHLQQRPRRASASVKYPDEVTRLPQRVTHAAKPLRPRESPDEVIHGNDPAPAGYLPTEMLFAGWSDWGPHRVWSHSMPLYYALELCLAGDGMLTIGGRTHHIRAGDMFIMPAGVAREYHTGATGRWRKVFVGMARSMVAEIVDSLGLGDVTVFRPSQPKAQDVERIMNECILLFRDEPEGYRMALAKHAYDLLLIAAEAIGRGTPLPLTRAMRYVRDNVGQKLTVTDLARIVGYSRSGLYRLFYQHTGMGVHQWLVTRRVERAKAMLTIADSPIKTVADHVGYAAPYQFSAVFRRVTGLSPSAFRRESRADTLKASHSRASNVPAARRNSS